MVRNTDPTGRRARILAFIIEYKITHDGLAPTMRGIMNACDVPSSSLVQYHLELLAQEGKIVRYYSTARGIKIVGGKWTYEEPRR